MHILSYLLKCSDLPSWCQGSGFNVCYTQLATHRRFPNSVNLEANFYPMTTMGVISDDNHRLTLHSGQPHGVASLREGS